MQFECAETAAERGPQCSRLRVSYAHGSPSLYVDIREDSGGARRHRKPSSTTWLVDETYVKILGKWYYLYRGVDTGGQVLDCLTSHIHGSARKLNWLIQH